MSHKTLHPGLSSLQPSGLLTPDLIIPEGAAFKGGIRLVQAKVTVPIQGTGIKISISLTYANRTELIKDEKEIGANIGFAIDMDRILNRLLN